MSASVGCAILAAGASRRLGRPKQLVEVEGVPLLRRAAVAACGSRCAKVAVVLGAHAELMPPCLRGMAIETLSNADWPEGIASSIRAAAAWAIEHELAALLLCVADQVFLSSSHLDALLRAREEGAQVVASRYGGKCGVPALFPRSWFSELARLRGDRGASFLLRRAEVVDWPPGDVDVDTPSDLPGQLT